MQVKRTRHQIYICIIFWLLLTSCNNSKAQEYNVDKYILIWNYGIDTLNKVLAKNESKDLYFNVSYITLTSLGEKYYTDTTSFIFPKSIDSLTNVENFIELIGIQEFLFEHKLYKVYKYLMDNPNIADEEELYFYTPEIGILITESGSWFGYERLIESSSLKNSQLAFYLSEKVISDNHFFNSWKK